ncbi:MAG TPA: TfoX/Sxy family protein [Pyrinomonadaceae bacterium]|nr:TfoX/Sxy family protein [Pyrinomonadaceae bacterium]
MTTPISELANLGPKSEAWLNEIGIFSKADIERVGSVGIYRLLRARGLPASLNLVYAIEAMLIGEHWTRLPANQKAELRATIRELAS